MSTRMLCSPQRSTKEYTTQTSPAQGWRFWALTWHWWLWARCLDPRPSSPCPWPRCLSQSIPPPSTCTTIYGAPTTSTGTPSFSQTRTSKPGSLWTLCEVVITRFTVNFVWGHYYQVHCELCVRLLLLGSLWTLPWDCYYQSPRELCVRLLLQGSLWTLCKLLLQGSLWTLCEIISTMFTMNLCEVIINRYIVNFVWDHYYRGHCELCMKLFLPGSLWPLCEVIVTRVTVTFVCGYCFQGHCVRLYFQVHSEFDYGIARLTADFVWDYIYQAHCELCVRLYLPGSLWTLCEIIFTRLTVNFVWDYIYQAHCELCVRLYLPGSLWTLCEIIFTRLTVNFVWDYIYQAHCELCVRLYLPGSLWTLCEIIFTRLTVNFVWDYRYNYTVHCELCVRLSWQGSVIIMKVFMLLNCSMILCLRNIIIIINNSYRALFFNQS